MLDAIKNFFEQHLNPMSLSNDGSAQEEGVRLAAAALMVELMETDHDLDERETKEFLRVLQQTFKLESADLQKLVELAHAEAQDATSLYQFTSLINEHYTYEQKVELISAMWRLAFADERLDKYEESLIRQVAELIYVSHADFIQTKLKVRSGPGGEA